MCAAVGLPALLSPAQGAGLAATLSFARGTGSVQCRAGLHVVAALACSRIRAECLMTRPSHYVLHWQYPEHLKRLPASQSARCHHSSELRSLSELESSADLSGCSVNTSEPPGPSVSTRTLCLNKELRLAWMPCGAVPAGQPHMRSTP